jgi:hypothetical protein
LFAAHHYETQIGLAVRGDPVHYGKIDSIGAPVDRVPDGGTLFAQLLCASAPSHERDLMTRARQANAINGALYAGS